MEQGADFQRVTLVTFYSKDIVTLYSKDTLYREATVNILIQRGLAVEPGTGGTDSQKLLDAETLYCKILSR